MIKLEKKTIENKDFYYLREDFRMKEGFKKISVYLGKNVPKDLNPHLQKLKKKESTLLKKYNHKTKGIKNSVIKEALDRVDKYNLDWKYFFAGKNERQKEKIFSDFAVRFIFESNSIEGSKLSEDEVKKIVNNKYLKKSLGRVEVQEVLNSLDALDFILGGEFKLNQKNIKKLHRLLTSNLNDSNYLPGKYKTQKIIVNNKETTEPKLVKPSLESLIKKYKSSYKTENKFFNAIKFHNNFELIHPFSDGNGRTGRMILIWMLTRDKYDLILFKKKNMKKYFNSLDKGDNGQYRKILVYAADSYKDTVSEFIKKYS